MFLRYFGGIGEKEVHALHVFSIPCCYACRGLWPKVIIKNLNLNLLYSSLNRWSKSGIGISNHSAYGISQWKTMLQSNIFSHWLSPYAQYVITSRWYINIGIRMGGWWLNRAQQMSIVIWWYQMVHPAINILRPGRNGHHFADNIWKCIFFNEKYEFWLWFHLSLFLRVQLTIYHHWFR